MKEFFRKLDGVKQSSIQIAVGLIGVFAQLIGCIAQRDFTKDGSIHLIVWCVLVLCIILWRNITWVTPKGAKK